ncbi:pentatricopeptide repeat-containing protein At4g19220, mitochondrial-like [Aristolochia californica]|uniref:pentatricopeptide repeat-containing protein At4g19220, mitochondrial-like n=1 Tax=Aristolochia californica TaxID=171875 RepID=UPI0035E2EA6B
MLTDMDFDSTTLLIVISALSNLKKLQQGRVLHGITLKWELNSNRFLGNALLDMLSTVLVILPSCNSEKDVQFGESTHCWIVKSGFLEDFLAVNALMLMYLNCRDVRSSISLLETNKDIADIVSWNTIIVGSVQNGCYIESLKAFNKMQSDTDIGPDSITLVSVISASGNLELKYYGAFIHGLAQKTLSENDIQGNSFIYSALVDMYSKCGRLEAAVKIFRITSSTFIALISACTHSGFVDEGWKHYNCLVRKFGIKPTIKHHVCMVHMLGRAGRLDEAYECIKRIANPPESGVWGALLSACKDHGDLEMEKSVAEHLIALEPENTGYYILLANMYSAAGRWNDVIEVRKEIQDKQLRKPPGWSSIDLLP